MSRRSRAARRAETHKLHASFAGLRDDFARAMRRENQLRSELHDARDRLRHHELTAAPTGEPWHAAAKLIKMVRAECIANPPPSYATKLRDDIDWFDVHSSVMAEELSMPRNALTTTRLLRDTMHVLQSQSVREMFSRRLHLRVRLAGGQVGYAISEEALLHHDVDDVMEKICEELARSLIPEVKNALRKRGEGWSDLRSFRG